METKETCDYCKTAYSPDKKTCKECKDRVNRWRTAEMKKLIKDLGELNTRFSIVEAELKIKDKALNLLAESLCIIRSKYDMECIACPVDGQDVLNIGATECYQLLVQTIINQVTQELRKEKGE